LRKVTNKGSFITTFDPMLGEVFYGVSTGFDFCAEHESGIQELQESAGITRLNNVKSKKKWFGLKNIEPKFGLERTTILNTDKILQGIAETDNGIEYYLFGYNIQKNKI